MYEILLHLSDRPSPLTYTIDPVSLRESRIDKLGRNIVRDLLNVFNMFVDFEQDYHLLRFFSQDSLSNNPAPQDSMHGKIIELTQKLEQLYAELDLPRGDGSATKRWWDVTRIRHILHNLEVYYKRKEECKIEYKNLRRRQCKQELNHRIL